MDQSCEIKHIVGAERDTDLMEIGSFISLLRAPYR